MGLALLPKISWVYPAHWGRNNLSLDRTKLPLEYDLGVEAWERERGIVPAFYTIKRPKPRPSWNRLVKDLGRKSARDRAWVMIEERVPAEALAWLQETMRNEDWLTLRLIGHERTEQEIRDRALMVAKTWEDGRRTMTTLTTDATNGDEGAAAPPALPQPML